MNLTTHYCDTKLRIGDVVQILSLEEIQRLCTKIDQEEDIMYKYPNEDKRFNSKMEFLCGKVFVVEKIEKEMFNRILVYEDRWSIYPWMVTKIRKE